MSTAERLDDADERDDFIIDPEEGRQLFDATARRLLGISGAEFQRRWHAGEYYDIDTPDVIKLYMMLPLVETIAAP